MRRSGVRWMAFGVAGLLAAGCGAAEEPPDAAAGGEGSTEVSQPAEQTPLEQTPVEQTPVEESFAGERITMLNPFAVGGGLDAIGRFVAGTWGEYIPGNPEVVWEQAEGGGGAVAMHELLEQNDPDGLTAVLTTGGVITRWLTGEEGHDYDLPGMQVIGAFPGSMVTTVHEDIATNTEELLDHGEELTFGATAPGARGALSTIFSTDLFDIPARQVYGFGTEAEVAVSMERGEVDGGTPVDAGYVSAFESIGIAAPIYQTGKLGEDGEVVRGLLLPDVPTFYEEFVRVRGEEPAGDSWEAYQALLGINSLSYPMLMHPDTEEGRLAALREAFDAMINDPEWQDEAEEALGGPVDTQSAGGAEAALQLIAETRPEIVELLSEAE